MFTFFLAFESLLIPMIIMIALWGSKNNRQANNYLIFYTMVSALPMLLAILYLKIKLNLRLEFTSQPQMSRSKEKKKFESLFASKICVS